MLKTEMKRCFNWVRLFPILVVTDLQMPDLDGLELVNAISERYPGVPVVLMTTHGSENIAAQALASSCSQFCAKIGTG